MSCPQRIIHNADNLALTATLAASSVLPASDTALALPIARDGSADLVLSGAFSDVTDAEFEIEVVDTTVSVPVITSPVFSGEGNGELSGVSFTGSAQSFALELVDAGSESEYASVPFAGVKIAARQIGTAGNSISISVDDSAITFTEMPYSFIAPLPQGTRRSEASGLDFAAVAMEETDVFPASAKRLVFGADRSQIYLQAKQWTGSAWEYVFEPELKRAIAAGERVYEVSGTYSATVTNGSPETPITGIKTNYDFLNALNTQSALVRVEGVIANDRAVDGQAAIEFSLKTKAFAKPVEGSGSSYARDVVLRDLSVGAAAPTELVELRCWAVSVADHPNAHLGAELWQVSGAVSGLVSNFATGELITSPDGYWQMRIPSVYPDGYGSPRGDFTVTEINQPRAESVTAPQICMRSLALGPEAVDQTIELVYTKRPTGACLCDDMPFPDLGNSACLLGPNNPNAEGGGALSYPANVSARLIDLWDWYADLAKSLSADRVHTSTIDAAYLQKVRSVVIRMQEVAIKVSPVAGGDFTAAMAEWDSALVDFKQFAEYRVADGPTLTVGETIAAGRYVRVLNGQVYLARGAAVGSDRFSECDGYTAAALTAGDPVNLSDVRFPSNDYFVTSGVTPFTVYGIDPASPGQLSAISSGNALGFSATAQAATLLKLSRQEAMANVSDAFVSRISVRMDSVLATAKIDPVGKYDAATISDDGCWRDPGDAYYWTVVGDRGSYMPAFTNQPYYSSRETNGQIRATYEFAFYIQCKCPGDLKVGDTIRLAIGDAGWPATYQVGDVIRVPIQAGAPLALRGGHVGSANQTWHVSGSVDGAFAPFVAANSAGSYSDGGLAFTMSAGGVRFAEGDRFVFAAEGGRWRWRKNGGTWSSLINIGTAPVAMANGLSVAFTPGVAPSFTAGDAWKFVVQQPNAVANAIEPQPSSWRWSGATATLDLDFGTAKQFDSLVVPMHRLPSGATLTIQAGTTSGGADVLPAVSLDTAQAVIAWLSALPLTARYVRVSVASATNGAIGWVWVGKAFGVALQGDTRIRREYAMQRTGGRNVGARLLGAGRGGEVVWSEAAIDEDEMTSMFAMIDALKRAGDAPIVFFPSLTRPDQYLMGRVDADQLEFTELTDFAADGSVDYRFSGRLPIAAWVQ